MRIRLGQDFIAAVQKTAEEIDAHFALMRDVEDMLTGVPKLLHHFFTSARGFEQTNGVCFPAHYIKITPQNWDRHIIENRALTLAHRCFSKDPGNPKISFLNCTQTDDAIAIDATVNGQKQDLVFPFDDNYALDFPTTIHESSAFKALQCACQTYGGVKPVFSIHATPLPKGGIARFPGVHIITTDRQTIANKVLRYRQTGPMH